MPRRNAFATVFIALAACALTACGLAGRPDWRPYHYDEQEFAVSFPAEPAVSHPVWGGRQGFTAELVQDDHDFSVVVIDASGYEGRTDYVLQGGAVKLAQAVGGQVRHVGYDSSQGGVPGLRVVVARPGQADVTARLFYFHSKLYEVGDMRPGMADDQDAERFLTSFRLVGPDM